MVGVGPDLVYDICTDLLGISVAALEEGGCEPIDRAYVEIGNTLAPVTFGDDCVGQLTVTAGPFQPDLITDLVQRRQGRWSAAMLWKVKYTITLLRCHPMWSGDEGDPLPSPEQINAEAINHYRDAWQLARVLSYKWMHQELVPSFAFTNENVLWPSPAVTVRPPQGGIRGWDLSVFVSIHDHYEPEEVTP